jgi:pimeloyl-ACP methyl ester carboxylesterase
MNMVDIGGRRLATSCSGEGNPTVVLETGLGPPASAWEAVASAVASTTSVCYYDRANRGESDPAPTPRTAENIANDLRALIEALELPLPLVIVGHSFGGLVGLSYASRWREDLVGLVLVDPTHPEQFTRYGPLIPDAMAEMKEFWTEGWLSPEGTAERIDFQATFDAIRKIDDLGDLRLSVLTSGTWMVPAESAEDPHEMWVRLHQDYVRLSTRTEQRVVPEANHFIQLSAPDAVVEAITSIVSEIREGEQIA